MVKASLETNFGKLLRPLDRAADARSAFGQIIDVWRGDVSRQFDSGSAEGIRWKERIDGTPSRLQASGVLKSAWLGGPGSITTIEARGARFGIDGDRIPYAVVHRGTAGEVSAATFRTETRIAVTPRMRRYLAAVEGVYLRGETRYVVIPARPHALASDGVVEEAAKIYAEHLTS